MMDTSSTRLSRRAFLGAVGASAGFLAAPSAGILRATGALAATTRNPLYIAPVVDLGGLASPYQLTAAPGRVDLGGGSLSNAWVYNGLLPGPTFRIARGGSAQFTLHNGLSEPTITH